MQKTDYKKALKPLYNAKTNTPTIVEVPSMNYLSVNGHGDPNTSVEYIDAIEALYPVAYAIKFMCKKELGEDFGVMPLEGLWWTEDMDTFSTEDKSNWLWTALILQPNIVTKDMFDRAIAQVSEHKNPKSLPLVRFTNYTEGH